MAVINVKSGRDFNTRAHLGASVAIIGKEYRPSIRTVNGARPAYKADVLVLAGDNAGQYFEETLIFGNALVNQLKKAAASGDDNAVIGTLVERPTEDGEYQYFLVDTPTDAELVLAAKFGV